MGVDGAEACGGTLSGAFRYESHRNAPASPPNRTANANTAGLTHPPGRLDVTGTGVLTAWTASAPSSAASKLAKSSICESLPEKASIHCVLEMNSSSADEGST